MTVSDPAAWAAAAQLYFPLAGLIGLAFWTGALSNEVKSLKANVSTGTGQGERIVRLETKMDSVLLQMGGLDTRLLDLTRALAEAPPPTGPGPIRRRSAHE